MTSPRLFFLLLFLFGTLDGCYEAWPRLMQPELWAERRWEAAVKKFAEPGTSIYIRGYPDTWGFVYVKK